MQTLREHWHLRYLCAFSIQFTTLWILLENTGHLQVSQPVTTLQTSPREYWYLRYSVSLPLVDSPREHQHSGIFLAFLSYNTADSPREHRHQAFPASSASQSLHCRSPPREHRHLRYLYLQHLSLPHCRFSRVTDISGIPSIQSQILQILLENTGHSGNLCISVTTLRRFS
jgi:hypothetical protein